MSEEHERIVLALETEFRLGDLTVRPDACEVQRGSAAEKLEPRVMQVLVILARALGKVVSRDDLLRRCWNGTIVGDDAINRVIGQLRRLLQRLAVDGYRIETIPKVGYRLCGEPLVEQAAAPVPPGEPLHSETPVAAASAPSVAMRSRPSFWLAWVGGLAIVLLVWAFVDRRPGAGSERVAVLTFAVAEQGGLQDYAQALGERIRSAFSNSSLQTVARADEDQFRSSELTRAASRNNVGFVLDGSVRQEGGELRVHMTVIDALANQSLWAVEYRRRQDESLLLQEQVAAHAADVLRCALLLQRPRAGSPKPEILSLFLRTCDQVSRFDGGPADLLGAAVQLTELAPTFSRGWSMLAMANAYASRGSAKDPADGFRRAALEAAERAESLDPANGEALLARAVALPLLGAWDERDALIAAALEREPASAQALLLRAELYSEIGRVTDALEAVRQSVRIDPLSPTAWAAHIPLLLTLGYRHELEEVRERLYRTWPRSPSAVFNRFNSAIYAGEYANALAMMDGGIVPEQPVLRDYLVAGAAGDADALRRAATTISVSARAGQLELPSAIALMAAAGDLDEAFALADLHFDSSGSRIGEPPAGAGRYVVFVYATMAMREDPRFMPLMRTIGLFDYWLDTGRWPDMCSRAEVRQSCGSSEQL